MAVLLISATPDIEQQLETRDLRLTFEYFKPTKPGENCAVTGDEAEIEKFVWRYVTRTEDIERGDWLTREKADVRDLEDFEHFLWLVDEDQLAAAKA